MNIKHFFSGSVRSSEERSMSRTKLVFSQVEFTTQVESESNSFHLTISWCVHEKATVRWRELVTRSMNAGRITWVTTSRFHWSTNKILSVSSSLRVEDSCSKEFYWPKRFSFREKRISLCLIEKKEKMLEDMRGALEEEKWLVTAIFSFEIFEIRSWIIRKKEILDFRFRILSFLSFSEELKCRSVEQKRSYWFGHDDIRWNEINIRFTELLSSIQKSGTTSDENINTLHIVYRFTWCFHKCHHSFTSLTKFHNKSIKKQMDAHCSR